MKKLFATLAALVGAVSIMPTIINKTQQSTKTFVLESIKEWEFDSFEITKDVGPDEWLYFAIDNINLSSMGITSIDHLHKYTTIEITDLIVIFDNYQLLSSDQWKANRELGSENWYRMFTKQIGSTYMTLESASTIWYSDSSDLMMRLAYHAAMMNTDYPVSGGTITFDSGSVIKIY